MKRFVDGSRLVCGLMVIGLAATSALAATGLDEQGQLKSVLATTGSGFGYRTLDSGVQVCVNGVFKNVLFYGPEIVRVNANLGQPHTAQPSLTVVTQPAKVSFKVKESGDALTIASDKLRVLVNKQTGALTFQRPDGTVMTRERPPGPAQTEAAISILHQWALQNFDDAAAWVELFPEGEIRERAINELTGIRDYSLAGGDRVRP